MFIRVNHDLRVLNAAAMFMLILLGLGACDDTTVCISTSERTCDFDRQEPDSDPPRADAGPDQVVAAGTTVLLDASASSAGSGSISAYAWRQTTGTSVALLNAASSVADFVAPAVSATEVLQFSLTVTNSNGKSATDSAAVTVEPASVSAARAGLESIGFHALPTPLMTPDGGNPCPGAGKLDTAQIRALWLQARTLGANAGLDDGNSEVLLDQARVLVATIDTSAAETAAAGVRRALTASTAFFTRRDPAVHRQLLKVLEELGPAVNVGAAPTRPDEIDAAVQRLRRPVQACLDGQARQRYLLDLILVLESISTTPAPE